jgi:uncharacterized protein (TIRG00374 family)
MKLPLKKTFSYSLLIILLAFFVYYIKNHLSDFTALKLINPLWLIPLFVLFLFNSWTNGLIVKYLAEPFKIKLSFKEHFGLSIITSFYNMITPFRGGLAAKAVYLKQKHNFKYTDYLATVAGLYVINFFIGSVIGLIGLWIIYAKYQIFNWVVFLIFIGFAIPLLGIIIFSPHFPETKYKWLNQFIRVMNGWNIIRKNKKIIALSSIVIIIQILVSSLSTLISYSLFDVHLSFVKALFLTSIGTLSILIQITPSGLGINEAIAIFSGLIIGITPAQALIVSILGRIIGMVTIFILGPIFSYILLKHKPKNEKRSKK